MRQLDLGCGNVPRQQDGYEELWGIDISSGDHITNPCVKQGIDLAIEPIPFEDNYFDLVTAYDFMEHIPSQIYMWSKGKPKKRNCMIELFNEIYRVLVPGGRFMMKSPFYPHSGTFQDPTHVFFWTPDSVNYFSGDYFGMYDIYGHTSRFEKITNDTANSGWIVIVLKAIKSLPKDAALQLSYGGID